MNTKPNKSKLRAFRRSLIVLPALAAVSLAVTGAASAQTTVPFQASVDNISTNGLGNPGPSCTTGYYCGNAIIAGYGTALWSFDESPDVQPTPVGSDCWHYTGTSTFTLVSDGSALVLNESNVVLCFPGNSGNTPNFWKNWTNTYGHSNPYGHPSRGGDTPTGLTPTGWTVCNTLVPLPDPSLPPTGCGERIPSNPTQIRYSTGQFSELTGGSGTGSIQSNGAILTGAWSGTLTF